VLAVRVPVCSGVQPQRLSAASAQPRALAPSMPYRLRCPIRSVLVSFAGGTWSLLLVLPLSSGVDGARCNQSFPLFPTDWAAAECVACRTVPSAAFRNPVCERALLSFCSVSHCTFHSAILRLSSLRWECAVSSSASFSRCRGSALMAADRASCSFIAAISCVIFIVDITCLPRSYEL
jgi:hypothetical protein